MFQFVTSHSTERTFIELFFVDTCVQVIQLWYILLSFQLWLYMMMMMYCDLFSFDVYVLADAIGDFS
jgi:hypothetical protein